MCVIQTHLQKVMVFPLSQSWAGALKNGVESAAERVPVLCFLTFWLTAGIRNGTYLWCNSSSVELLSSNIPRNVFCYS